MAVRVTAMRAGEADSHPAWMRPSEMRMREGDMRVSEMGMSEGEMRVSEMGMSEMRVKMVRVADENWSTGKEPGTPVITEPGSPVTTVQAVPGTVAITVCRFSIPVRSVCCGAAT
jgi:hypothetical protein